MNWNFNNNNNNNSQTPYNYNVFNRMGGPHYELPLMHGRVTAEQFPIGPNSQIILPDGDNNIVWWIRTDQMGNKTVTPFAVSLYTEPTPADINSIEARLAALEEKINAKYNKQNAKRNPGNVGANNVDLGAVDQ